jgi:hypothetical protein
MNGNWDCLRCHFVQAPVEDEVATCGQRELKYCPQCCDVVCFEFVSASTASVGVGGSTAPSAFRAPVAVVAAVPLASPTYVGSSQVGVVEARPRASSSRPVAFLPHQVIPSSREQLADLSQAQLGVLRDSLLGALALVEEEQRDRKVCIVCAEQPKAIVFYPCKHMCTCGPCSEKVTLCPVCRQSIADRIRPFD